MTNAGQLTLARPTRRPARAEPATLARIRVIWLSPFAAMSPLAGTTRGTIAVRAGVKNVPIVAWAMAMTYMSHNRSVEATRMNPSTSPARSRSAASITRRRSQPVDEDAGQRPDDDRRDGQRDGHGSERGGRSGQRRDHDEQRQVRERVADVRDALGRPEAAIVGDAQDVAGAERRGGGGHRSGSWLVRRLRGGLGEWVARFGASAIG